MFDPSGFCHIASNARNRQKWSVFIYKTTDTESQMLAQGYFNAKATELNLHDMILALREQPSAGRWVYSTFIVTGKTTDTITVSSTIMSAWVEANLLNKTDRNSDFMTPVDSSNKGATATEINELIQQITGVQTDLTNLINTKATKATDFVSPITDTNKGITQVEQSEIESQIDRAATSGKVIGSYWFGKTAAGDVPNPTMAQQNYFDFTTNTPYTAKADLSGWDAQPAITPPANIDAQILITSKFWNIPEQAGQQGGKAFWSHTDGDWAYFPTIVSFESPALSGTPTTPNLTSSSPGNQIANKQYVDSVLSVGMLNALYPVGSIYITTTNNCPLVTLIPGSQWEAVAQGRALWGTTDWNLSGTTIEAGLPNIAGTLSGAGQISNGAAATGALQIEPTSVREAAIEWHDIAGQYLSLDASRSSAIYGSSSTVQPPAYRVSVFRRVA